ncbi:MAG: hypothetical protein JRI70_01595 [Deltaproteobacteria bacterium]|nr:hypothetical protein [Deltaproteobacteria bacterium]MBW2171121.1 hypothetical protein [Deltaproteobacteria bacterium]
MKPMNLYSILLILFLLYPTSAIAQSKSRVKGTMPKSTMKATAKPDQLPEQPMCTTSALPDIMVKKIELRGPSGPLKPGQKCNVNVHLRNIGQCETGVFFLELRARVQVPSIRKDDTETVGAKKVYSIAPRKAGSPGTSTVSFSYTLGNYQWAQYNFTAVADSTNHITEFNEANNEKYGRDEVADALRQ